MELSVHPNAKKKKKKKKKKLYIYLFIFIYIHFATNKLHRKKRKQIVHIKLKYQHLK